MTKKLTRSQRKELRTKGQLKPVARLDEARKAAEKQAEERAAGARVHEAREALSQREDAPDGAAAKSGRRPDLTMLLMLGLLGLAALLFYLSQRPPAPAEARPAGSADATKRSP